MPRLPDRVDLWVRRARACADSARQADFILGALTALPAWHFLNTGTTDQPQPAEADLANGRCLLLFSDSARIAELIEERGMAGAPLSIISIPMPAALAWCLERRATGCAGLLLNAGENAVVLAMDQVEAFAAEWDGGSGQRNAGFWMPHLTTEEEDFWQEHGW